MSERAAEIQHELLEVAKSDEERVARIGALRAQLRERELEVRAVEFVWIEIFILMPAIFINSPCSPWRFCCEVRFQVAYCVLGVLFLSILAFTSSHSSVLVFVSSKQLLRGHEIWGFRFIPQPFDGSGVLLFYYKIHVFLVSDVEVCSLSRSPLLE